MGDEFITSGFDTSETPLDTSTIQPADTGGVPPTTANDKTSSGGFLGTLQQYGGAVADAAKTYLQFEQARGAQQVALSQQRAGVQTALSKAAADQQVAALTGQAAVAAAQAKANSASAAAARAGSFSDELAGGKYNTLIIALTLAGLGFAYLQSLHHG